MFSTSQKHKQSLCSTNISLYIRHVHTCIHMYIYIYTCHFLLESYDCYIYMICVLYVYVFNLCRLETYTGNFVLFTTPIWSVAIPMLFQKLFTTIGRVHSYSYAFSSGHQWFYSIKTALPVAKPVANGMLEGQGVRAT